MVLAPPVVSRTAAVTRTLSEKSLEAPPGPHFLQQLVPGSDGRRGDQRAPPRLSPETALGGAHVSGVTVAYKFILR